MYMLCNAVNFYVYTCPLHSACLLAYSLVASNGQKLAVPNYRSNRFLLPSQAVLCLIKARWCLPSLEKKGPQLNRNCVYLICKEPRSLWLHGLSTCLPSQNIVQDDIRNTSEDLFEGSGYTGTITRATLLDDAGKFWFGMKNLPQRKLSCRWFSRRAALLKCAFTLQTWIICNMMFGCSFCDLHGESFQVKSAV